MDKLSQRTRYIPIIIGVKNESLIDRATGDSYRNAAHDVLDPRCHYSVIRTASVPKPENRPWTPTQSYVDLELHDKTCCALGQIWVSSARCQLYSTLTQRFGRRTVMTTRAFMFS